MSISFNTNSNDIHLHHTFLFCFCFLQRRQYIRLGVHGDPNKYFEANINNVFVYYYIVPCKITPRRIASRQVTSCATSRHVKHGFSPRTRPSASFFLKTCSSPRCFTAHLHAAALHPPPTVRPSLFVHTHRSPVFFFF